MIIGFSLSVLVILSYFIYEDVSQFLKGVPIDTKEFWSPDSTRYFAVTEYSLGVFGGGYTLIALDKDEQFLKFSERAFIKAGWSNVNTIRLYAYEVPRKKSLRDRVLNIELILKSRDNSFIDTLKVIQN